MAYGFQSIKNSRTFLVVQLSPIPAPSQPQPPTQSRRIPTQPQPLFQGLFSPKPAAQILGQVAARARRWAGCGWLLAGGVRLRSSPGRLQAGWGMRGWGRQKKSKKSQLEKSKKVKCADPSLGGLLEATKRQKKVKSGKSKKESKKKKQKKVQKKTSNVKTKRGS